MIFWRVTNLIARLTFFVVRCELKQSLAISKKRQRLKLTSGILTKSDAVTRHRLRDMKIVLDTMELLEVYQLSRSDSAVWISYQIRVPISSE